MTKPNWTPIKIKLGNITCWEHNPRMSNKAQAQRLIESEKRWGQPMSFAVSPLKDGKVELYDGHQRFSAWVTVYGEDYEVDARQCDRHLTEEERLEFVVTMHAGATGSWDWQKLSSFPAPKLIDMGFDEALKKQYDFDANNIKELLNSEEAEPVDAEPQIDRAAELAEKWQTKSGQLWKLGEHRLLIGDCTVRENVERLMGGERAGACVTDPPYGIGYEYDTHDDKDSAKNDDLVRAAFLLAPECIVWTCGMMNTARELTYYPNAKILCWHKGFAQAGNGLGGASTWEPVLVVGAKKGTLPNDYLDFSTDREKGLRELHSCPKPIKLFEHLITHLTDGIIYEPFCGSGTTLLAGHNAGRRVFACELSEKYGAVILERFFTATGIQPELVTE